MKKTFPIAVMLLSTGAAVAQEPAPPPAAPDSSAPATTKPEEILKVVIVSTGSRGSQRTVVDAPVPVDIINTKDLNKTGQISLDKALGMRVPSFNTVQTPVNDATSLLDPYEIRNMGPSRSLILINGKRKNSSALIYTQTSPGRGESGSDISAIPQDAIKRIEVLRDGASAQYGSDAISGVVNIILKDNPEGGSLTARAGVTGEGDGKMGALSLNHGIRLSDKGFVNYTIDVSKVGLAERSGIVDGRGDAADFGADLQKDVLPFLAQFPTARNVNGSPKTRANKFLVNSRLDITDDINVYGNAAYVKKQVDSIANYRTPYWRPTDFGLLHAPGTPYVGYGPEFIGKLDDYNATLGTKFTVGDWNGDVSVTIGGNKQAYEVHNSVNRGIENARLDAIAAGQTPGPRSPTSFEAGGTRFRHTVVNADVSRQLSDAVNVYAGTELRREKYDVIAGEFASYTAGGADSYAGNLPENALSADRKNYGVYGGSMFDISKQWLIDLTGRYEKYSDFGNATVGKLSTRYKVSDMVTLRGSVSSGFRAPSLHQIYTQKKQYSFVAGSGIQVSGLTNNESAEARALKVPQLKAEKSKNLTLGLGLTPDSNTSITLDYYHIALKDRIILGKEIAPTGDPTQELDKILAAGGVVSLSFFANALDSQTSGIDYVVSRKNIPALDGKLAVNLSGNYTLKNERDGAINNPPAIAAARQSVLDATQEALMFTSRPKHKTVLGLDLDYSKFNFSLNNTVYGPTQFRNAGLDQNLEVKFKTRNVTDFALNYQLNDSTTLSFNVNNLFDVLPKWELKPVNDTAKGSEILSSNVRDPKTGMTPRETQVNLITFNGRYPIVTYDGSHFSQLGRMFNMSLNVRF
ncbi:TonB-dependent receptor [Massilia atriviolacea]|uniref:TonB-dependent receptor n=1 Tax=Massilia atriviolacea TaxID=2495579 RepID=A0A430HGI4_9BURK|nr:TonB-dependent receptor [Massilia atriviolacea]